MFYVDLPSPEEIGELNSVRSSACVSIYVSTTPLTHEVEQSRIRFGNHVKDAVGQLEEAGFDKRQLLLLKAQLSDLSDDETFWNHQANSLAVFATPESIRTYRMASEVKNIVEVSDRFHIKPLLRAVTFPHAANILALSENSARLIEMSADLPAREVDVPNMPRNAAEATGKGTRKITAGIGDRGGSQGEHLGAYVRQINAALRPVLKSSELPLILATTKQLEALVRSVSATAPLSSVIPGNSEHLSPAELADAARPILEAHYAEEIKALHQVFETRTGQNRTTTDVSNAARLATFGGIDTLLIDIDNVLDGFIDDETGEVSLDARADAVNYDVVDEIAGRALRTGANVLAVRKADIPGGQTLAAISRYPV